MSTTCRGCGESIDWVKTTNGKPMPVDTEYVTVVTDKGEVVKGRVSHFATCAQADRFRKRGAES
jgi:hypothetical protein